MLTLSELKEQLLKYYDPDDLVDVLNLTSEEILDAFEEKVYNIYKDGLLEETFDGEPQDQQD